MTTQRVTANPIPKPGFGRIEYFLNWSSHWPLSLRLLLLALWLSVLVFGIALIRNGGSVALVGFVTLMLGLIVVAILVCNYLRAPLARRLVHLQLHEQALAHLLKLRPYCHSQADVLGFEHCQEWLALGIEPRRLFCAVVHLLRLDRHLRRPPSASCTKPAASARTVQAIDAATESIAAHHAQLASGAGQKPRA